MVKLGAMRFRTPISTQVHSSLLRYNYLPAMGKRHDEVPPSLNSTALTIKIARELTSRCGSGKGIRKDFDAVPYEATRFNLVARQLAIPHPLPYAQLVGAIAQNWPSLKFLSKNSYSQFRPANHGDGRLFAMNYGRQKSQNNLFKRWIRFGAEYRVSADVANFYPGFYTHSIPWALVGHQVAKQNRQPSHWYNELDMRFRDCNRGETLGLHVGPGTSALGAEIVLSAVDSILKRRYKYIRFVDDYEFYAKNREEAEEFILDLSKALSSFGLKLNGRKTKVEPLPLPGKPDWMRTLIPQIPRPTHFSRLEPYLEEALELAKTSPDGSVLKFAIGAVLRTKDIEIRADEILPCLFTICFHSPGLLPEVSHIFDISNADGVDYTDELNVLLKRHARFRRSDGMSWVLHIMRSEGVKIEQSAIDVVIDSADCIPILLLHHLGQGNAVAAVEKYAKALLAAPVIGYDIDRNWVLFYELFRQGVIANPYKNNPKDVAAETAFDLLVQHNVSFLR
ncbi:antiviral reverse transcriptase Drt4 [Nocardia sp. NPDC055049]